jgi:hypothetical protein
MSASSAAVAVHESLTTPDSEDWSVIPDRKTVHMIAYRETRGNGQTFVFKKGGAIALSRFKQMVEGLPKDHDLGCVTVHLTADAERCGGITFFAWMREQARAKGFSLMSIHGPATTKEAVRVLQSYLEAAK